MKVGYLKVCSRASDIPAFICISGSSCVIIISHGALWPWPVAVLRGSAPWSVPRSRGPRAWSVAVVRARSPWALRIGLSLQMVLV